MNGQIGVVGRAFAAVVALLCAGIAEAKPPLARIASVQGTVESQREGQGAWAPVKLNELYSQGDQIRVGARSRADLVLLDRSVLRLNENSALTIQPVKGKGTGAVDLLRGAVHIFSRGPDSLAVNTPFTVAGVRGTEFLVEVEQDRALVTTFEGLVVASNDAGSVAIAGGQSAVAERGKAPVMRVVAKPRDAVQWALYYPPVLYFRADEFPDGPGWQGKVRRSLDAYGRGDLSGGFQSIADVETADLKDQRFFTYRAHLLLAVGRIDQARADVDRALALSAKDPEALSLQTIAAVVQNDPDRAQQLADAAVAAGPRSATARVALSYARQARFDVGGARAAVAEATELDPRNALAWARLAELHSAHGELAEARAAADRAVALDPNLARTQTVLGYAALAQTELPAAGAAFEKAIALDSADPLPRLGLGLAKIRAGDVAAGSRDLETAASLDPGNPVVRSYLGKAYYEEKRTGLDEREFASASEVDPRDPTPYFYGAISKQATNRPVEALQDLERAMERNDNRAVYRSRLLLDSDLAARSASLGRVYSDLGFQQLALVEGWKSVNVDPTNFSAHRFLADSYAVMPRHEIARVSELLQAQLLQPLNVAPIQPQLAESNLSLAGTGGPAALSFNEFNPIFNRDRVALLLGGLVGDRGAWNGEVVAAGVYRNASVSAGYSRYQTDGFRTNSDQKAQVANAFAQAELSPATSVQAEYRYRDGEQGDLTQTFDPANYLRKLRAEGDSHTFRLGGRHVLAPDSIALASVVHQRAVSSLDVPDEFFGPGSTYAMRSPQRGTSVELGHVFRSRAFNLRTGAGYFDVSSRFQYTVVIPGVRADHTTDEASTKHRNAYAYADVRVLRGLAATLGMAFDSLSGDRERDQFSPKLGVVWTPLAGTTVRAAAFRVLKRTLVTNQTIEPTQVAGFNQFFDDASLTDGWRYGGAVDQKLGPTLWAGVEASRRDLFVPYTQLAFDPVDPLAPPITLQRQASWQEDLGRGYLFWTPHRWVALSAEYALERADRGKRFGVGIEKLDTQRVPLGVRLFHPVGLGVSLAATWWDQRGTFESLNPKGHDDFWMVDAGVSYRLPRRNGVVAFGVANLFDEKFKFYETDFNNPRIQPVRRVFGKVTVALP